MLQEDNIEMSQIFSMLSLQHFSHLGWQFEGVFKKV
jgi:hypothetical protein